MSELLFHVALKVVRLPKRPQYSPLSGADEKLRSLGAALEMVAELAPHLTAVERIAILNDHGLFPKELLDNISIRRAIDILSIPDETPDEAPPLARRAA